MLERAPVVALERDYFTHGQRREPVIAPVPAQVPDDLLSRGEILVLYGDSPLIRAETLKRLVDAHRKSGGPVTLASVDDPSRNDGRRAR